jgi:hypothetical protein
LETLLMTHHEAATQRALLASLRAGEAMSGFALKYWYSR